MEQVKQLKAEVERLRAEIRGLKHIHELQLNTLIKQLNDKEKQTLHPVQK